jgi:hypothetical protein
MEKVNISSLEEFEQKYKDIINIVSKNVSNIETNNLVTFTKTPKGDATPNIEYNNGKFCYVISERGEELERIESENPYYIMYILFQYITFLIASDYELKHRIISQDSRRLLFKYQVDLLRNISEEWAKERLLAISAILEKHPYVDK